MKKRAITARVCKYSANSFCYVCDELFAKRVKKHCLNNCICAGEASPLFRNASR